MSQGQKVRPEVVEQIKRVYAELVAMRPGGKVTAKAVYKSAKSMLGEECPKIRRVQQIVKETTPQLQTVPEDPGVDLWNDPGLPNFDPEGIARLFRLQRLDLLFQTLAALVDRPLNQSLLNQRTAKWALRLHRVFTGAGGHDNLADDDDRTTGYYVDGHDLLLLRAAQAYTLRERACLALGIPLDTGDLDAVLIFRVWESESHIEAYERAVERGVVPAYSGLRMRPVWTEGAGQEEYEEYVVALLKDGLCFPVYNWLLFDFNNCGISMA